MSTKKEIELLKVEVPIAQGIQVEVVGNTISVKGPKGEVKKSLISKAVKLEKKDNKVILTTEIASRHGKRMIYSFASHVKNMINGVQTPYIYKLKVCSGHFPISIKLEKDKILITNFLGEKVPRISKIMEGAKVNQQGDVITVEGADVENVSQTAANLEIATRITNRDRRRFQDGIYLTEKAGVKV